MNYFKKLGAANLLMLILCAVIILVAEYLFLTGDKMHGIFVGLWAPTLLGVMIYLRLVDHGGKWYCFMVFGCCYCARGNMGYSHD